MLTLLENLVGRIPASVDLKHQMIRALRARTWKEVLTAFKLSPRWWAAGAMQGVFY